MKSNKQPVGEVECSHKGCTLMCKVYKFEPRSGRGSVFTGKFYFICPSHGRIGADGAKAVTEYVLESGRMYGANQLKQSEAEPVKESTAEPELLTIPEILRRPEKPAPKPVQPVQAKQQQTEPESNQKRGWFGL